MGIELAKPGGALSTEGLLKLLTWVSPSFPVGAFAYSHGLETACEQGWVLDEPSLEIYVRAALEHGSAAIDAGLFAGAWTAVTARDGTNFRQFLARGAAMRSTQELAAESCLQGAAFWKTLCDAEGRDALAWADAEIGKFGGDLAYPCAMGAAAGSFGLPLPAALNAYLHGFAANLISAGVRIIPLGQTAGQRITSRLAPVIANLSDYLAEVPFEDLGSSTFMIDIASMSHETQYTRLFRS